MVSHRQPRLELRRTALLSRPNSPDGSGEPSYEAMHGLRSVLVWDLPPPPGFQVISPDKPVTVYERHLRHWRQDGAAEFVTFRLPDCLPQSNLDELAALK